MHPSINKTNHMIYNLFENNGTTFWEKAEVFEDLRISLKKKNEEWSDKKAFNVKRYADYLVDSKKVTRRLLREGEFFLFAGKDFQVFLFVYNYLPETLEEFIPLNRESWNNLYSGQSEEFDQVIHKAFCNGSSTPFFDKKEMESFKSESLLIYWDIVCLFLKTENDTRNTISLEDIEKGKYFKLYGRETKIRIR